MPQKMSMSTAFEAQLYFHQLFQLSSEICLRELSAEQNAVNGTLAGTAFRLKQKDWNLLRKSCSHGPLFIFV